MSFKIEWWIVLLIAFLGLWFLTGCLTFDPIGQLDKALSNPAVQATLDEWAARGSLHNPRIGGQITTGFEVYTIGVDVEGNISGDARSAGIDPALLEKLVEIAKERGYVPPATQPAPP